VSYLVDLAIGDADNDGDEEIILGVGGGLGFPMYLRRLEYNPGTGTYDHKMMEPGVTGLPLAPHVDDIDGDGLNELVMGSALVQGGILYILEATADDTFTEAYRSPDYFDGNVLTTTTGPLFGRERPGIAAGSFGGALRIYGHDGDSYRSLLAAPITSGGSIRGTFLGSADGDDRPEIVFASKGDDRVYVYEQIKPIRVSNPDHILKDTEFSDEPGFEGH
jgi:hypothetical protein